MNRYKLFALADIEAKLQSIGSNFRKFTEMPSADELVIFEAQNKLILDELSYDITALTTEHDKLFLGLTDEQRKIYHEIMDAISALDRSLKDIMRSVDSANLHKPFGGKVIVFTVFKLTRNMRVQTRHSTSYIEEIIEFSDLIQSVGDGNVGEPNDGTCVIDISDNLRINGGKYPISTIIHSTYPCLTDHLWEAKYFQERAILAPTNEIVETVNDHLLSTILERKKNTLVQMQLAKKKGTL
ncbi:uncharacterized protein LOC104892746 [Beta vulgaris subsp. vulgaris]|uniref:uncharacterized protein LOC104892746 n=1 Tax=Beta vulgaris subsp. vulgaris TaxID=3555 RepID=UPI00053F4F90|nr:uncharacterized protein LOC104892746 [Beta vulgaris subsp. vulgaris]